MSPTHHSTPHRIDQVTAPTAKGQAAFWVLSGAAITAPVILIAWALADASVWMTVYVWSETATLVVAQDVPQFKRDVLSAAWRWRSLGPRLVGLAMLASVGIGCLAGTLALLAKELHGPRGWRRLLSSVGIAATYVAVPMVYDPLMSYGTRTRVARVLPDFQQAADGLLNNWPDAAAEVPPIGVVFVSDDPNRLIVPPHGYTVRETIGTSIVRRHRPLRIEFAIGSRADYRVVFFPDAHVPEDPFAALGEGREVREVIPMNEGWYLVRKQADRGMDKGG